VQTFCVQSEGSYKNIEKKDVDIEKQVEENRLTMQREEKELQGDVDTA